MRVATLDRGQLTVFTLLILHVSFTLQHCKHGIDLQLVTHLWYNTLIISLYSRTPLIRINWDGKPSGYAENTDNWIYL